MFLKDEAKISFKQILIELPMFNLVLTWQWKSES